MNTRIESSDIVWDAKHGQLRGNVQDNGGDPSTLFFHVPDRMQLSSATLHGTVANARQPQANVLAVGIPALAEPTPFVLFFAGNPAEATPRPLIPGRAATRFEK